MKIKKLAAIALAAATVTTAAAFASCSGKEKLIVYTEAGFAPWEFTKEGSTEVIGVDVEIAKYIANKYDYELEIINGSFDSIVAGISEDNALGIAGISWKAERAEKVEYSDFYYGGAFQSVVYLKSSNPTLTEDNDFAVSNFEGAKVVYQTGTTSQMTIDENKTAWKIDSQADFSTVVAALQEMKDTAKTYLIVDSQVAAQLVASNSDCAYSTIEGVDAESYGVVAKKGNTALIEKVNAAIKELLVKDSDGKTQIDKWLAEYEAMGE
ncbi:MAG: transporter substrate-binding domain-containing protein [Candidatus Scatosoma sp.]